MVNTSIEKIKNFRRRPGNDPDNTPDININQSSVNNIQPNLIDSTQNES
jgi:hypothetical protein